MTMRASSLSSAIKLGVDNTLAPLWLSKKLATAPSV